MSQSLDISDLIQFKKKLSDVVDKKTVRKLFRAEHRAAGEEMKRLVRDGLPGSKKVASWQIAYYGSKGGYAAIRPQKGTHEGYAKGYITNAIENGHWVPERVGSGRGYHKNGGDRRLRVHGLGFYARAREALKGVGRKHSENLERRISQTLQDLGR